MNKSNILNKETIKPTKDNSISEVNYKVLKYLYIRLKMDMTEEEDLKDLNLNIVNSLFSELKDFIR